MNKKMFLYIDNKHSISDDMIFENIMNIDNYTNNAINHIVINDLLDYYEYNIEYDLLKLICDKIISNGFIEIQAPDINELCIAKANLKIDDDSIKSILYNYKKSIHTIYDIENMLINLNYKIIQKRYINIFEYYILAQKNEA